MGITRLFVQFYLGEKEWAFEHPHISAFVLLLKLGWNSVAEHEAFHARPSTSPSTSFSHWTFCISMSQSAPVWPACFSHAAKVSDSVYAPTFSVKKKPCYHKLPQILLLIIIINQTDKTDFCCALKKSLKNTYGKGWLSLCSWHVLVQCKVLYRFSFTHIRHSKSFPNVESICHTHTSL